MIRLLRAEKVPFHVISVLSRDSLAMPEEMLAFYLAEGKAYFLATVSSGFEFPEDK